MVLSAKSGLTQRLAMNLEIKLLADSWFAELDLRGIGEPSRIPIPGKHPNWKCAANQAHGILCTQLISSTPEMREGWYWYLFAARTRLYVLRWGEGHVRIEQECVSSSLSSTPRSYPNSEIVSLGTQAIQLLYDAASRPNSGPPTLVGADGKPLVYSR
jgi:hypothetical protein